MAHISRIEYLSDMMRQLGPIKTVIDDGTLGAWGNCKRAWQQVDTTADYGFVLQDDAILCEKFVERTQQLIEQYPGRSYQLYFGDRKTTNHHRLKAVDGVIEAKMMWGVAIGLPIDHIAPMIEHAETYSQDLPDDSRIKRYCTAVQLPTIFPYPCYVDHRTIPSLTGDKPPRKAYQWIDDTNY